MGNRRYCLIYVPTVERRDVMENADSVDQEQLVLGEADRIKAFGVRISRVSPSGKYISQLRVHKRRIPLWWQWETVGYNVTPSYEEALAVAGRFVNSIFSKPIPSGYGCPPILLEYGSIYQELPDDM